MKNQTVNIVLVFLTLFFSLGAFFPFVSLYLQDTLNYSGAQIGLFFSLAALSVVISVPLFGVLADKIKNPKFVYIFCSVSVIILLVPFSFLKPFYIITTLYILINGIRSSLIPLLDTVSLDYCAQCNVNYGIVRAVGSLSFIFASVVTGFLLETFSEYSSLFIYIHIIFIAVSIFFMSKQENIYKDHDAVTINFKKDLVDLIKNKQFLLVILIMGLANGVIQVAQVYLSLSIVDLGANVDVVGIAFFFLVIPEVIFIGLVIKFTRKIPHIYLMLLGAISLLVRWLILLNTSSVMILLFASTGHGIVIAFMIIVGFDLIKKIVKPNMVSSALSLYTASANIFFALISFIAGFALDSGGIRDTYFLYFFTTLIVIVAIIVYVILYSRRTNNE